MGVLLDSVQSGIKLKEAFEKPGEFEKVAFEEGGRLGGSIGGGAIGATAGYIGCNALFGLVSGGTSILWCGLVAGGLAGAAGGKALGAGGKRFGELVYEKFRADTD